MAYYNRGNSYLNLSQFERAIQDCNEAIRLDPEHAMAYANRVIAYTMLSMDAEAEQDAERAVELGFDRVILETQIERVKKLR